jgi:hypothetical protein
VVCDGYLSLPKRRFDEIGDSRIFHFTPFPQTRRPSWWPAMESPSPSLPNTPPPMLVVVTGPFIKKLLHNNFTTKKYIKKSGDVNDEANFSFFCLLHK